MIQRKQSVFLLMAVIVCIVCLFLPIAGVRATGMEADAMVYNLGIVKGDVGINFAAVCLPLFLLLSISIVISLATIFLFKNRKLQMSLCAIASLFTGLWCIDWALLAFGVIAIPGAEGEISVKFAACLPVVALILQLMARKGVSDDEKLIKAADRIR